MLQQKARSLLGSSFSASGLVTSRISPPLNLGVISAIEDRNTYFRRLNTRDVATTDGKPDFLLLDSSLSIRTLQFLRPARKACALRAGPA
jgi:hypothetical protein